jgi:hypothetical protein
MTIEELLKSREGKVWGPVHTAQVVDHLRKVNALAQQLFDATKDRNWVAIGVKTK